jgi:hypothetical protein
LLCAKMVTVPALSLFRVCEYGVGLGDLGKPLGGIRVMGVHVWMGGSREGVELSGRAESFDCLGRGMETEGILFEFCRCAIRSDPENFIVVYQTLIQTGARG